MTGWFGYCVRAAAVGIEIPPRFCDFFFFDYIAIRFIIDNTDRNDHPCGMLRPPSRAARTRPRRGLRARNARAATIDLAAATLIADAQPERNAFVEALPAIRRLDRYERRAMSRRSRAMRARERQGDGDMAVITAPS